MSYAHEPVHHFTASELAWIFASPVIVLWDAAYVLLRPITMPGGPIHRPMWVPYELYSRVDYLYGFPGLERGDGIVAAYAVMNLLESCLYLWSAWKIFHDGAVSQHLEGVCIQERYIDGHMGSKVVVLIFATSLVVCVQTVLYGMYFWIATVISN